MKSIAEDQGADAVLREICRFDTILMPDGSRSNEYPRDTNAFKIISKYYSRFVMMLTDQEEHPAGHVDNDDDGSMIPYEFMCPVSHELLQVRCCAIRLPPPTPPPPFFNNGLVSTTPN